MNGNTSGNKGEAVGMWKAPETHQIRSSTVLGGARKMKGEYILPFAMKENERADARFYVEAMPQMPCKATGYYVGGETFTVENSEIVVPGQWVRLEIPEILAKKIGQSDFSSCACGILTSVERWPGQPDSPSIKWKLPMGACVVKEQVPSTLRIAPNATVIVQWQPEVASRFKRFATEIIGNKDALHLNDFRFGKDSLFLSSTPVPFPVISAPGAFEIPDIVTPGIIVTASVSNHSDEEVILGGGIVFENAEDELLALHKKYEEEQRAGAVKAEERGYGAHNAQTELPIGGRDSSGSSSGEAK